MTHDGKVGAGPMRPLGSCLRELLGLAQPAIPSGCAGPVRCCTDTGLVQRSGKEDRLSVAPVAVGDAVGRGVIPATAGRPRHRKRADRKSLRLPRRDRRATYSLRSENSGGQTGASTDRWQGPGQLNSLDVAGLAYERNRRWFMRHALLSCARKVARVR
jgi:hypothetical protein